MSDRRHADLRYEAGLRIPGTVYRVIAEIGHGGMGRVYEVEDTTVGKRYALKTLLVKRPVSERTEVFERMRQESRTLVRVAHPNIVDVITAGVSSDEQFYYVMELLTGRPLRKLLARKKRLESHLAVPIAIDVADALARAHSEGVIHRDVKPDNIFVVFREDTSTTVKIVDFGVAAILDDLFAGREAGRLMGTLKYASPEQQRGAKADPSMDIWALGITLFEMVVGHLPFRGKSMQEYILAVQSGQPADRISEFLPEVMPELDTLCARLLEKTLGRRIPSMVVAASELRTMQRLLQERRKPTEDDHRTEETLGGAVAFSFGSTADGRERAANDARPSAQATPVVAAATLDGMGPTVAPLAPTGSVRPASMTSTPDPPEEWRAPRHPEVHAANPSNESDTRFLDVGGHENPCDEPPVAAPPFPGDRDPFARGTATPELPVVVAAGSHAVSRLSSLRPSRRRSERIATVLPLLVFAVVVGVGGTGAVLLERPRAPAARRAERPSTTEMPTASPDAAPEEAAAPGSVPGAPARSRPAGSNEVKERRAP